MNTSWDLQESIKYEKTLEESLSGSVKKWQHIIETFSTDTSNVTNSGLEWKVRYECQKLYNQMIQKQIQRIRVELRMMRCGVELSPFKGAENETIGELRTRMRNLRIEKCSTKSLLDMYGHQLDMESMAYHHARDELEQLTKDIRNNHVTYIREQEKADSDAISSLETSNRGKRLKPIAKIIPIKAWPAQNRKKTPSYANIFSQQRAKVRVQDGNQGQYGSQAGTRNSEENERNIFIE